MKNNANNAKDRNKGMTEVSPGHWVANGKTLMRYLKEKAKRTAKR